ncbi:MAG: hypothetical protein ACR2NU_02095 [Aeoliella sp.]
MKNCLVTLTVGLLAAALAADVYAQGRGGRGGFGGGGGTSKAALLRLDSIQEEIGLEEIQIEDIDAMREELRGERGDRPNFRDMSEEEREQAIAAMREQAAERQKLEAEKLADILDSDQLQRLTEIFVQVAGVGALGDAHVREELNISDDDAEEISEVTRESTEGMRDEMRELFQSGDRDSIREKMTEIRSKIEEQVLATLTTEQQQAFEELKGEPFELSDEDRQSLRRGRGGRGGGDGRGRGDEGERRRGRPEAE